MKKNFLLLILAVLLPKVANADKSGQCGDNLTWTYYESTKSLVLAGSGDMWNYHTIAPWFNERLYIESITLPDGLTSIGDYAFFQITGLTTMTIPNSVTDIGESAFERCSCLTSLTIPNSVTSIGDYAFLFCYGLTSVIIPNSVTSIGDQAFYGCSGLTTVTIPNSVTSIGNAAFASCTNMTSLTIGNSVSSIGGFAFHECFGLTSVTIPNSVTSIGNATFEECNSLKTVTIGNGIKTIGSQAFASCKELTDVYCHAENVPSTTSDAFQYTNTENATLHVPAASLDNYKDTEPWSTFGTFKALENETQKCATPSISYQNGKLSFGCATEGVEFISEITDSDIKKYYDNKVQLTATYNISVYATKTGYDNSYVATATLCWIDKEPVFDVTNISQVHAQAVLIQSEGGMLTVQGLDDGQQVRVYGINGTEAGAAVSSNGQATVGTNLKAGSVAIIKIGDRSVKVAIK